MCKNEIQFKFSVTAALLNLLREQEDKIYHVPMNPTHTQLERKMTPLLLSPMQKQAVGFAFVLFCFLNRLPSFIINSGSTAAGQLEASLVAANDKYLLTLSSGEHKTAHEIPKISPHCKPIS